MTNKGCVTRLLQTCNVWNASVVACLLILAAPEAAGDVVYVNGSCGNNSWTGRSSVCAPPHGPKLTIQAAIDAASVLDTIEIANGAYTGLGNGDILVNKQLTIRSASNDPELCVINCGISSRGFTVAGTWPTHDGCVIQGLSITHGSDGLEGAVDPFPELPCERGAGMAGAIVDLQSPTTIRNCVIILNSTSSACGRINIAAHAASLITDSQITDNTARAGGGIVCQSLERTQFSNCTIRFNDSRTRSGGIVCMTPNLEESARLALINCQISFNSAEPWPQCDVYLLDSWKGGFYAHFAEIMAINCTINTNHAIPCVQRSAFGVGAAVYEGASLARVPTILDMTLCLVSEYTATTGPTFAPNGPGGGDFNQGGTIKMVNCTIVANVAEAQGGGLDEISRVSAGLTSKLEHGNRASYGYTLLPAILP